MQVDRDRQHTVVETRHCAGTSYLYTLNNADFYNVALLQSGLFSMDCPTREKGTTNGRVSQFGDMSNQ